MPVVTHATEHGESMMRIFSSPHPRLMGIDISYLPAKSRGTSRISCSSLSCTEKQEPSAQHAAPLLASCTHVYVGSLRIHICRHELRNTFVARATRSPETVHAPCSSTMHGVPSRCWEQIPAAPARKLSSRGVRPVRQTGSSPRKTV